MSDDDYKFALLACGLLLIIYMGLLGLCMWVAQKVKDTRHPPRGGKRYD